MSTEPTLPNEATNATSDSALADLIRWPRELFEEILLHAISEQPTFALTLTHTSQLFRRTIESSPAMCAHAAYGCFSCTTANHKFLRLSKHHERQNVDIDVLLDHYYLMHSPRTRNRIRRVLLEDIVSHEPRLRNAISIKCCTELAPDLLDWSRILSQIGSFGSLRRLAVFLDLETASVDGPSLPSFDAPSLTHLHLRTEYDVSVGRNHFLQFLSRYPLLQSLTVGDLDLSSLEAPLPPLRLPHFNHLAVHSKNPSCVPVFKGLFDKDDDDVGFDLVLQLGCESETLADLWPHFDIRECKQLSLTLMPMTLGTELLLVDGNRKDANVEYPPGPVEICSGPGFAVKKYWQEATNELYINLLEDAAVYRDKVFTVSLRRGRHDPDTDTDSRYWNDRRLSWTAILLQLQPNTFCIDTARDLWPVTVDHGRDFLWKGLECIVIQHEPLQGSWREACHGQETVKAVTGWLSTDPWKKSVKVKVSGKKFWRIPDDAEADAVDLLDLRELKAVALEVHDLRTW